MEFKNWQWAVTDYGIEAIEGAESPSISGITPNYILEANRLVETTKRFGESLYDWPVHMAEKTWVDIDAFIGAFENALETHKERYTPAVDPKILEASIDKARSMASR